MVYLNVTEIESALKGLAATHPDTCQLIELPERTDEGRTCFALRIGSNPGSATKGILFTANAHAREWGGADCAVNFAADVLTKYADGRGIAYGGIDWSANEVKRLVDTMDVFVVPCVNPDGRAYSQGTDTRWRKNRSRRSGSSQVGVDINRNFDILWDSERVFDPEVVSYASMGSSRPAADTYRGPSPHSEPETRNIVSLLDDHPQIGWLFDIHCYSGEVLHSWGGSPNQWTQPEMNFRNQDYDGQRGTHDASVYAEYIPYPDFATQRDLATSVSLTMRNVRGEAYQVHQSFYLVPDKWKRGTYPTGGIVDDYAFSRHLADPTKPKVHGFTLEFGLRPEFQPPWPEMERIVLDVCAGMMDFCFAAGEVVTLPPLPEGPIATGDDIAILTGIIDGGPGWVLVNGKPVPVDPPDRFSKELLQEIALLQVGQYLDAEQGRRLRAARLQRITEIAALALELTVEASPLPGGVSAAP